MKPLQIVNELTSVAKNLGITVRKEKGSFRSGFCFVNSKPFIVINQKSSPEYLAVSIAKSLSEFPLEGLNLKPNIREMIEKEKQAKIILESPIE